MKIILFSALVFMAFNTSAQQIKQKDVPKAVKATFASLYPSIKDVDWEKEESNYEASFEIEKSKLSLILDSKGNLLETERQIKKEQLPASVLSSIGRDYVGYQIEEAATIESKGSTTYEAELEKGEESFDLIFSADGAMLKKTILEKDKSDNH